MFIVSVYEHCEGVHEILGPFATEAEAVAGCIDFAHEHEMTWVPKSFFSGKPTVPRIEIKNTITLQAAGSFDKFIALLRSDLFCNEAWGEKTFVMKKLSPLIQPVVVVSKVERCASRACAPSAWSQK